MVKQRIIEKIFEPLERAGFHAFFVGGCVRDELMGVEPHDYDVVTDAHPEDIEKVFGKYTTDYEGISSDVMYCAPVTVENPDYLPLVDLGSSEKFGVVVVNLDGSNVEIATFRKDVECDGRKAKVELL